MTKPFLDFMKDRIVFLDGAMGTELMKHGLIQGASPEALNSEKPDAVELVYKSYYDAGSDAVLTNSFGGNKIKLDSYGLSDLCYELNKKSAEIATEICPAGKYIGGSMGPTGKFLKPQGEFTENEFEEAYEEQARGLSDGQVDFLLIETQYDLKEALCALRGARKASSLPVFLTLTFNNTPKGFFTIMGDSVSDFIDEAEKQDIEAIGSNCTLDSQDMTNLIKQFREKTNLPLIAQANAGQPSLSEDNELSFSQNKEDYVRHIPQIVKNGANIIGGCCGTDPSYISLIIKTLQVQS
jgi:5-methyltetrahydrofolate--homocysteine methyltransferase